MSDLLAWLEYPPSGDCIGAFVAADTPERKPARRRFADEQEARAWIEAEAAAFGAAVRWLAWQAPDGCDC